MKKIIFFSNGNTMVFEDGVQQPMLQHPWIVKFFEFLESQGLDPTAFEIRMPDGTRARPFRAECGWNWEVK